MDERMRFIVRCGEVGPSFTELCREFGISRKTGYKWVERYNAKGPSGLEPRPTVAAVHPNALAVGVVSALVLARKEHPFWGPKKLLAWLVGKSPRSAGRRRARWARCSSVTG